MKLAIGGDHAGFDYKKKLVEFLKKEGHDVKDFGPDSDASVDYPDHVHPLSEAIEKGEQELGILLCGSANGVAMTANKHQGIRAGIAWEEELAELTRQHNNANVLCIPARFIDYDKTLSIVKTFLATEFEGGRHGRRVDKIGC